MDLELTDEQTWLNESVETLLARLWVRDDEAATAGEERRAALWQGLVEFGALSTGGEDGLGAVELCLVARALGARLAAVPYAATAAARFAAPALAAIAEAEPISVAVLEPGGSWSAAPRTELRGAALSGRKVAVEYANDAAQLVVEAVADGEPVLAAVPRTASGVTVSAQDGIDPTVPLCALELDAVATQLVESGDAAARLRMAGALLGAAEAVGAAGRMLDDARGYAAERRQFGHTIGSFQALRHILADMHVAHASAWSTVLYAAASLDDPDAGDATATISIAKAYVGRACRDVGHGAMQVFGGIAFTAEHPAHRFLRRIIVRDQQFGDALHHERALGRALAVGVRAPVAA